MNCAYIFIFDKYTINERVLQDAGQESGGIFLVGNKKEIFNI